MRLPFLAFCVCLSFQHMHPASAAPVARPETAGVAAKAFSRNQALPKWAEPLEALPATTSEEPVVIRLAETQYWTGAHPAYLVNRAVQVNSSSRLSELGQLAIGFVPAYQKLVLHRVAIVRDGQVLDRTLSANIRVLDSESDAGQGYYHGAATAQLLLDDVKPGDTLWTTYSVEGSNPVFGSVWSEYLPWTKESPMELRKVTVLYPAGQPVLWRISGEARASLPAPVTGQRNGIGKMVFQEKALAAQEYEVSTPPNLIPMPLLDMSQYQDWGQVARWALALFPDKAGSAEVQALARKFSAGTDEERASQALHWVQDEIRYFSVSMGENSHRPQLPEAVLKRRFGDCKDKSLLLVSLLRAMGMEAQAVLLHASAPTLPAQLLPSPGSFNHAIVRVVLGGKAYFIDPTLQNERGQISALPVPVPSAAALIVSSNSTGLVTLPAEAMDEALVERSERMTIGSLHGDAQLQLKLEYRGRYAAGMRRAYRAISSVELKKMLLEQFERTYPGVQIKEVPKLGDGAGGASFIVEAQFTLPKVLKEKDGDFSLAQRSHIIEGTLGLPQKLVRKQPFWLDAGRYRARYSLEVTLPNEARLVKEDDSLSVKNQYFDARAQLAWRGASLNYGVDYVIGNPEVAPADVAGLVEQARKLDPLFETQFHFKPVLAPPQVAQDASLRVLDIMQKISRYEELQFEARRTGKAPVLEFEESVYAKLDYRALCESVVDSYSVREWNPLLAASVNPLHKMVDARADQRTKDLCWARLYLIDHRLEQASTPLAKLAPVDDDPLTMMQAWADFHAREPVRAQANLSRFLKAKSQAGTLTAGDALLGLALSLRLGMAEPAEIAQLRAGLRPAVWPAPLFSLLKGSLPPEDLQAAVARLPQQAREYAAMEAHFFISQAYLAAQQPRLADSHLNWFSRYGILGSAYEVLADADKYAPERGDADMRASWNAESKRGFLSKESEQLRYQRAAAEKGLGEAEDDMGRRYVFGREVKADVPRGLALLESAASKGNSNAMNQLGILYLDGVQVERDVKRALDYYRRGAENGNISSASNLGHIYWYGLEGMPVDTELAFRYLKDAAEMEKEAAQFELSRMYHEGRGTERNDSLSMFWATQAHYRKSVPGSAMLGVLLFKLGQDQSTRKAGLELLANAAQKGNHFAQYQYALLLLDGAVGKPDADGAFQLLSIAARGGDDAANALIARMYVQGLGGKQNIAKGMGILARLEKEKFPDAYYQLGLIYQSDAGGMRDQAKAADYFRRGAELDQRQAAEALAVMLHAGDGVAKNLPEAVRYYRQAIKSGYPRAMNNLAAMTESGEGTPADVAQAMELYRRAAQMGHALAMLNLAQFHEEKKEEFAPLAYYMLASKYGLHDADEGLQRMKRLAAPAMLEKAQAYVAAWKPGSAMPEES